MKRAKIILTALTVFTIVGGALAFKANNEYRGNLCCTFPNGLPSSITTIVGSAGLCPLATYTTQEFGEDAFCTNLARCEEATICTRTLVGFDL